MNQLISCHKYGVSKESQSLWQQLHQELKFDPKRTLFVDDSERILIAAQEFGIAHLLAVANPDSKKPSIKVPGFDNVEDYRTLLADIV